MQHEAYPLSIMPENCSLRVLSWQSNIVAWHGVARCGALRCVVLWRDVAYHCITWYDEA